MAITAAQNELMARVGPGTQAGNVLRQYWQPVALSEELQGARAVKAVRLMGQDLVLFRDAFGQLGLLDRDCPHRGADLAFGRLEDGGLRCAFHGWLFDVQGACLQTPAEPAGSRFRHSIRQGAYPVMERSGIVFAYLGDRQPPALPAFDCFVAPDTHTFAFKGLFECNWLQALEVGIDPAHASYLHRFFVDEALDASYGKQFRGASEDTHMPITQVLREYDCPDIDCHPTDWGLRILATRRLNGAQTHVRVTNLVFPEAIVIPMSADMTITQWHVPVDDTSTYWYAIFTSFGQPVDKQQMREQRLQLYELPHYTSRRNKRNDYGYDPHEQMTQTYTGMGHDINVHDQWAVESQGAIQDRTREHLAASDKCIYAYRRMLMKAMERLRSDPQASDPQAADPQASLPMMLDAGQAQRMTGPVAIDGVAPAGLAPEQYWAQADIRRRQACTWTARAEQAVQTQARSSSTDTDTNTDTSAVAA